MSKSDTPSPKVDELLSASASVGPAAEEPDEQPTISVIYQRRVHKDHEYVSDEPQEDALVLLVDWPSSAAAAPELPRPMVLLEVEVEVEPALSV